MFRVEDVLLLKDDERIRAVTRRHIVTLLPSLFLSLVLIVIPFFLLFPLFSWGLPGVIIFFAAIFIGLTVVIRALLLWDSDVLITTTMRLVDVDQRGLFTRIVSEAPLHVIQDVSWGKRGFLETIFGMGSVKVQTSAATTTIEARRIAHPQAICELLNELRHGAPQMKMDQPSSSAPLNPDKLKSVVSLLEKYSPEELARVETVLRARERSALADAFLKDGETTDDV